MDKIENLRDGVCVGRMNQGIHYIDKFTIGLRNGISEQALGGYCKLAPINTRGWGWSWRWSDECVHFGLAATHPSSPVCRNTGVLEVS